MESTFPSRKDLINKNNYADDILEHIKEIDISNIDFNNVNYDPESRITKEQKTFFWIRAYLKEEDHILTPDDDIFITYKFSGEKLECKFICYGKSGFERNSDIDHLVDYNPEDNRKILCLMVDSDRINDKSDDIPFIRTLFKIGRYHEYQLLKRDDLLLTDSKDNVYEYIEIDF